MPWIISNIEEDDSYWNNVNGWGDLSSATTFSDKDKKTLDLPAGGAWMQSMPKHKLLESSYEELARAMQELKLRVNHVENTLARIKAAMSPPSP